MIITSIIPYSDFMNQELLGKSRSAKYLYKYLSEIDAKTVVIEDEYVDREFLKDYARFYSRAYQKIPRYTIRYHIFSEKFTADVLKKWLSNPKQMEKWLEDREYKKLDEIYLGFIIKKPVTDRYGEPVLGRVTLRTYPENPQEGYNRTFVKIKVEVSLFGIPLNIYAVPFINQDEGVGVCSTAAIWTVNNVLKSLFDTPYPQSLAEITENAHKYPGLGRIFPSQGLNKYQLINYFKDQNLDAEMLTVKSGFFERLVKAFVDANMPLIAILEMYKNYDDKKPLGFHAVVITGYKYDAQSHEVVKVYVHDDQIGPYARVNFTERDGRKVEFKYEWNEMGYKKILLSQVAIPVYPKIRLEFSRLYPYAEEKIGSHPGYGYTISLKTIKNYKYHIWQMNKDICWYSGSGDTQSHTKEEFLEANMPRFLWVINVHKNGKHIADVGIDATSVHPKILFRVYFK